MDSKAFAGTLDSLGLIRDYVKAAATMAGLDKKRTYDLCLAVDEIATNIILYGYQAAGLSGEVVVRAEIDDQNLTVTLEDEGESFNPLQQTMPTEEDLTRALEDRPIGGLGLFLAIKGIDEFKYERVRGRNRNIFVEHLPPATQTRETAQA
ncbi:MAG TPA: anti-sigma regulatory factor [Terriglobia bacterium]|nr:anti-sigma regulatory factor [Terriglobia bacterium]